MGIRFLSSFFGNYSSRFLGTFRKSTPKEASLLMLTGLGLAGGVATWLLGRPLEQVAAGNDETEFRQGN
jgi:hypothetical protein